MNRNTSLDNRCCGGVLPAHKLTMGNIQYALIVKNQTKSAPSGSNDPRGIEANSSDEDYVPQTEAVLANITIIGGPVNNSTDNEQPGMASDGKLVANGTEVDGSETLAGMSLYVRTADTAVGTVSFASIQSTIFDNSSSSQRCLNCHGSGGFANGVLSLEPSEAYGELTGGSSPRVIPFDSANSLLVQKLLGTADGQRMPAGADPLSQELIDMVIEWIDNGAPETGVGAPAPCGDGCLANWPPLLATDGAGVVGDYSVFENSQGNSQWQYQDSPLYFFAGDTAPGDTNGASDAFPLATPAE